MRKRKFLHIFLDNVATTTIGTIQPKPTTSDPGI